MDEMITLQRGKVFNKLSMLQLGSQLSQIIQTAIDVLTKLCHNNAAIQQGLASCLDVFMPHAYSQTLHVGQYAVLRVANR